jgi:hypothetical protein
MCPSQDGERTFIIASRKDLPYPVFVMMVIPSVRQENERLIWHG